MILIQIRWHDIPHIALRLIRSSLKWTALIWYGNVKLRNGQWKSFNTHATTKREAKEMIAGIESEIAAGRDPWRKKQEGASLHDAQAAFLTDRTAHIAPKTLQAYRDTLKLVSRVLGEISSGGRCTHLPR